MAGTCPTTNSKPFSGICFEAKSNNRNLPGDCLAVTKGEGEMAGGEVVQWLTSSSADRQQRKDIKGISRATELHEVEVAAVGYVAKRAMFEMMQTNLLRREAEFIAPDGAELYSMIAIAAAVEMTNIISRMNRPGR